ncbi:hypothetical protein PCASD_18650 [Puccinia coronata f. sp. avenae]|uniref:Uncharacterized protein n=1 Tax=Puccinia coronata f. sp. avenae TaxID=200324 RepID=A0A2N5UF61_9BASI|nr:hypothetical protein PCASD_18650 [Puccinia coronata f. sp. avenae]
MEHDDRWFEVEVNSISVANGRGLQLLASDGQHSTSQVQQPVVDVIFRKSDSTPGQTLHSNSCGSSLERTVQPASEHPPSRCNKRRCKNSTPNLQQSSDATNNKTVSLLLSQRQPDKATLVI